MSIYKKRRKETRHDLSAYVDAEDREVVSKFWWHRIIRRITRANQDPHIYRAHITNENRQYLPLGMRQLKTVLLHRLIAVRAGIAMPAQSVGFKHHKRTTNYHRANLQVSKKGKVPKSQSSTVALVKKLTKKQQERWDDLITTYPQLLTGEKISVTRRELAGVLKCLPRHSIDILERIGNIVITLDKIGSNRIEYYILRILK